MGPSALFEIGAGRTRCRMVTALDREPDFSALELDRAQCTELMSGSRVARVVLSVECIPVALPVNVSVLDGDLICAADSGSKLTPDVDGQVVSVEADDIDLTYGTGWSVLVTGIAQVVSEPAEIDRLGARLQAWAPGPHPFLVRVPSTLMSGRRLMWGVLPSPGSNVPAGRPAVREEQVRRIPARVPAHVGGLTNLRSVARSMVESGVRAVIVEDPVGPAGLVTAKDIIEAVAAGGDPDIVWAGEIMRPTPRMVSCKQHPADVGEEMATYELDIVSVFDEGASVGLATALDILGAVVRASRDPELPES